MKTFLLLCKEHGPLAHASFPVALVFMSEKAMTLRATAELFQMFHNYLHHGDKSGELGMSFAKLEPFNVSAVQ